MKQLTLILLLNISLVQALQILVFSKTTGFRHESIADGKEMFARFANLTQWSITCSEDAGLFTQENLSNYNVVVFLSTTGDPLNDDQQAAFEEYARNGGGFVGIHAASDCEYQWTWYGAFLGAFFSNHPDIQQATIEVEQPIHPIAAALPLRWTRTDEWYNFQSNPRGHANITILATLDESTYSGGNMGSDHPIIWFNEYEGSRSVYIAPGHTSQSYTEDAFQELVFRSLQWAGRINITGRQNFTLSATSSPSTSSPPASTSASTSALASSSGMASISTTSSSSTQDSTPSSMRSRSSSNESTLQSTTCSSEEDAISSATMMVTSLGCALLLLV